MGEALWWRFQSALAPAPPPMRQRSSLGQAPPRAADPVRMARRAVLPAARTPLVDFFARRLAQCAGGL
jgi:hypothetical protein